MHELSMAQGIINAVLDTAQENNATEVTEVTVEVGRLAMINPEQLEFILGVLIENTIMEDAKIIFEEIPVAMDCHDCKFHGEAILDDSDHYAPLVKCPECDSLNVEVLNGKDIFCVDFVGAIGSGKTTLVEEIIDNTDYKIGVLAGDVISKFDAGRIEKHDVPVVGLNTGKECHLDAHLVGHGLEDLPLDDIEMVIIENVGNLICPVDFDLGSHLRIVVVSVTEGDDTVEKHPIIFQTSDVVVINKVDLADAVGADADKMVSDAQKLNPNIKIIKSSLKEGIGLDEIIAVIEEAKNNV